MADQLFNDDNKDNPQETPETNNAPSVNPDDLFADQLAAIKNEDGAPKYDSVEKAIEALQHSQNYIPELKTKVSEQEQVINELKAKLEATETVQDIVNRQTPTQEDTTTTQSLGEEDVLKLVTEALTKRSLEDAQSANQAQVNKALTERFGANAQAEVAKRAKELGMKPSEIGALSKSNPAAALALFGEKVGSTPTTTSSYNMSSTPQEVGPLKAPDKSLLAGATSREQADFMKKVRDEVYRKYGIQEQEFLNAIND